MRGVHTASFEHVKSSQEHSVMTICIDIANKLYIYIYAIRTYLYTLSSGDIHVRSFMHDVVYTRYIYTCALCVYMCVYTSQGSQG